MKVLIALAVLNATKKYVAVTTSTIRDELRLRLGSAAPKNLSDILRKSGVYIECVRDDEGTVFRWCLTSAGMARLAAATELTDIEIQKYDAPRAAVAPAIVNASGRQTDAITTDVDYIPPTVLPEPGPTSKEQRAKKPRLFIGSTVEALPIARAVQQELDYEIETTLWSQNMFTPGNSTWIQLVADARNLRFDLALLVLGGEDRITVRGKTSYAPRDNCLLEFGLFCGALGWERTFFLIDRDNAPRIASDLAGITPLSYASTRSDGNLQAAVGAACSSLRTALKSLS